MYGKGNSKFEMLREPSDSAGFHAFSLSLVLNVAINGELDELAKQAGVIKTEAQGEGWLQRSWRPIVMLVFTALIVCRWMSWALPDISETLELNLLGIVQLGIGRYIASRGLEKVTKSIRGSVNGELGH